MVLYLVYDYCLVPEDIRYHEATGRVEPDTIPPAIFPRILSESRAESTCYTSLMASRPRSTFKSTSYSSPLDLFSTKTDGNKLFWLRFSRVSIVSLKFTLLPSTYNCGYKDSLGTESYLLASLYYHMVIWPDSLLWN